MKILFINAVCGVGSTGKIVANLMQQAKSMGHTVKVACSTIEPVKGVCPGELISVGSRADYYVHNVLTRLTDHEGLFSKAATEKLLRQIRDYDPDIVHLHNLHGHWINYELLFGYLTEQNKKVIWTLHDCWAFTGHCAHFCAVNCEQWKSECTRCPELRSYPVCCGKGDVRGNFERKRQAFTSVKDLTIVTPSAWLAALVKSSFLKDCAVEVIHNTIDLSVFSPVPGSFRKKWQLEDKTVVLGVANVWNRKKGYEDFLKLAQMTDGRYAFVMVGLTPEQMKTLPDGIIGIQRTHSAQELAEIYSDADVFVNLTYQDTYPTVNLEAIACGTPVVSYRTGGSAESFDDLSGVVVEQGDLEAVPDAIEKALMLEQKDVLRKASEYQFYGDYRKLYSQ